MFINILFVLFQNFDRFPGNHQEIANFYQSLFEDFDLEHSSNRAPAEARLFMKVSCEIRI